jgi:hypothetical protein
MLIKVREATFEFCKKPKSRTTRLKYINGVMISCIGRHYQPTLWDALKACVYPRKLTLLASSFGAKVSLNPKVRIQFWFGPTQESSICPMPFDNPICTYSLFSWYNLLEVCSLYFTCNLMWYIYVTPCPIKRKVMSSSRSTSLLLLCWSNVEFFYGFFRHVPYWIHSPKMPLLDGILST